MKQNWSMKHVLHVQNTEVSVFRRLLIFRRQSVVVGGKKYASWHAASGVPQGSILGPLLRISYLYHISLLELVCFFYADDILLYRTISSNLDYTYLQLDASIVQDWVNCNHMFLNPSKCKLMLILCKRNRINNPPYYNYQWPNTGKCP